MGLLTLAFVKKFFELGHLLFKLFLLAFDVVLLLPKTLFFLLLDALLLIHKFLSFLSLFHRNASCLFLGFCFKLHSELLKTFFLLLELFLRRLLIKFFIT